MIKDIVSRQLKSADVDKGALYVCRKRYCLPEIKKFRRKGPMEGSQHCHLKTDDLRTFIIRSVIVFARFSQPILQSCH